MKQFTLNSDGGYRSLKGYDFPIVVQGSSPSWGFPGCLAVNFNQFPGLVPEEVWKVHDDGHRDVPEGDHEFLFVRGEFE